MKYNRKLAYVKGGDDFIISDDGEIRRVLDNEYAQCPRDEYGDYIDVKGFLNTVEDDSSWHEYKETFDELTKDLEIICEIEKDI